MPLTGSELHNELRQFYGSETTYKHRLAANFPQTVCKTSPFGPLPLCYTEGVKFLADNGNRWLLDAIASHMPKVARDSAYADFHIWILRQTKKGAELICVTDTDAKSMKKPLVKQVIQFTDFSFPEDGVFKLYGGATTSEDGNVMMLMLPNEK